MTEPKTETPIDWKRRLKLSFTMLVGSVIAWFRPQEIQRVLDDHLAAAERRRFGPPPADENEPITRGTASMLEAPMLLKGGEAHKQDSEPALGSSRPVLTAQELKAVTMAANLAKRRGRGKRENAAAAYNNSITVDDTRLILNAYFAHLAAQSHKVQSHITETPKQEPADPSADQQIKEKSSR